MFNKKKVSEDGECWMCRRNTLSEDIFLHSEDLKRIFSEVFSDLKVNQNLEGYCLCKVCAGIMKYTSQDSIWAKIKFSEASDILRDKFGLAKNKLNKGLNQMKKPPEDKTKE